jgi:hypothetical protein
MSCKMQLNELSLATQKAFESRVEFRIANGLVVNRWCELGVLLPWSSVRCLVRLPQIGMLHQVRSVFGELEADRLSA